MVEEDNSYLLSDVLYPKDNHNLSERDSSRSDIASLLFFGDHRSGVTGSAQAVHIAGCQVSWSARTDRLRPIMVGDAFNKVKKHSRQGLLRDHKRAPAHNARNTRSHLSS